ncbi:MAG: AMP-binding protein [Oceanospirillaceae bacterium]
MSKLLQQINKQALIAPSSIALKSEESSLSYSRLIASINSVAAQLSMLQVRHIGIYLDNQFDWVVIQLAAMQTKIPVTPIPLFFSKQQVTHTLAKSEIDLLFVMNQSQVAGLSVTKVVLADINAMCFKLHRETKEATWPLDTALVTYTSGTTAAPKGVCISYDLIDDVCLSLYEKTCDIGISQHFCLLPLSIMLENIAGLFLVLYSGATAVLLPTQIRGLAGSQGLDLVALSACLKQFAAQSLILTPQLLKALVYLRQQGQNFDYLKFIAVGGGRVPSELLASAQQYGLPVYEGYGLSECGSVVSLNTPNQIKSGSVGKPLKHCKVSITRSGELCVEGASMLGYLGDTQSEVSAVSTGDLAAIDSDGFLHIQGRTKSVQINSFGRNFNPEWIESEICAAPGIVHCAVFGDQRPFITAVIEALPFVEDAQLEQMVQQLNDQLPDYARINAWIRPAIPLVHQNNLITSNGRIRRAAIYTKYQSEIDNKYLTSEA